MAIVTEKDFEFYKPNWAKNSTPEEIEEIESQIAVSSQDRQGIDAYDIHDDCFVCNKKITVPFVYWHGDYHDGKASTACIHPECVEKLCASITADAYEIETGFRNGIHTDPNDPVGGVTKCGTAWFWADRVSGDPDTLQFHCPYCEKLNIHSAEDGHRSSHCPCWKKSGYFIRERHSKLTKRHSGRKR